MEESVTSEKLRVIIIDCTNIQFIDEAGVNSLRSTIENYESVGVRIVLTNCHGKQKIANYYLQIHIFCLYL